ncbi:putative quinol monooxygenase [Parascardovia denticolens]
MSLTVNLYYTGTNGSARKFAQEMESSGIAPAIRAEKGNEKYQYFQPLDDPETILLIDSWRDGRFGRPSRFPHDGPARRLAGEVRSAYAGRTV